MLPADHRLPYRMEDLLAASARWRRVLEFQPDYAPELLCATARLHGRPIGVIANRRGFLKTQGGRESAVSSIRNRRAR